MRDSQEIDPMMNYKSARVFSEENSNHKNSLQCYVVDVEERLNKMNEMNNELVA